MRYKVRGGGYLRPAKQLNLNSLYNTYADKSGEIGFEIFKNLEIKPIGTIGEGFLQEKENWILDDCNSVAEKRIVEDEQVVEKCQVVYGGFMRYEWGHFIVNTMSRLWFIYAHPDQEFDKIVFATLPGQKRQLSGNFLEFFDILGLADKIEFIDTAKSYETVIVPELSWSLQHHWSEEFNLVYDNLIKNVLERTSVSKPLPKKVFFTRSQLEKSKNCEIGIGFLDEFFEKNGFKVIAPETLSLTQMIHVMQSAEIVSGASGTTVHNILFGKRGQKLIIAERNAINNDFQPGINLARKLDVTYIDTFLTINSVNSGLGPFFYYPTKYLLRFANDNSLQYPSDEYFSDKWLKKNLRSYFKSWDRFYYRQWYFQKCCLPSIDAFSEAYFDSQETVGDYLKGIKLFDYTDRGTIRRLLKHVIKSKKLITLLKKMAL